jgi:hypothetical protein
VIPKRIVARGILTLFVFLFSAAGGFSDIVYSSYKLNSFVLSPFLMETLPGARFFPSFFENFVPDAVFLIEESNGFSLIDTPRVYFEGDSCLHFNWLYDGFTINSSLEAGAPGILLPFSSVAMYELRGETPLRRDAGLNFVSQKPKMSHAWIMFSNVWPNQGGYVPWAKVFVNPHATEPDRSPLLYTERRKFLSNYLLDFTYSRMFRSSSLSVSMSYFDVKRQFNDFNAYDNTFTEEGKMLLLLSQYERELWGGVFQLSGVYNNVSRDRFLAELGRLPQETMKKEKASFFSGIMFRNENVSLRLSFLHENEERSPSELNFTKDLDDNDGEGFFPFERWGSFSGNSFRFRGDIPFKVLQGKAEMNVFTGVQWTSIRGNERVFDFNPISFFRSPYLVIQWAEGDSYRNSNLHVRMGSIFSIALYDDISFFARAFLQYSAVSFQFAGNDLSFLAPGYDLGFVFFRGKSPEILVSYARTPYELRENLNFFLERKRPSGMILGWSDENDDLHYQGGEEGEVFGYTGGQFHSKGEDLSLPGKQRFLFTLSTRLSRTFRFNMKGLYKKIINNFWVSFKKEYGFYENIDGKDIYFFSSPFEEYELSNSSFDKDPFYGQLLLQVVGSEERKWYFSFSFMAHIGMGYTAFGNGPSANDTGILDESQANPNTWLNGYGRVDGGRAFTGKMYFGFYVTKGLFVSASLKYRDGNPFAFIDTYSYYGQRVLVLKTIQGEDERGIKGGPREDYVSDISLKVKYEFKMFGRDAEAFVSLHNLNDFGSELSEYVFSGGWRYANELQIPRSIRAGLAFRL